MENSFIKIKISLVGTDPLVWREFVCPAGLTLKRLHHVIQIVMGWFDYHEHEFIFDERCYLRDAQSMHRDGVYDVYDESCYQLCNLICNMDEPKFSYEYDFGQHWFHSLEVIEQNVTVRSVDPPLVEYIDGRRACPPEDIGGVIGYQEFLEALSNKNHEKHTEYISYYNDHPFYRGMFNPDFLDGEYINAEIQKYLNWSDYDYMKGD